MSKKKKKDLEKKKNSRQDPSYRPGASFINVAYAQKKAYTTLYAHSGIYKKRT